MGVLLIVDGYNIIHYNDTLKAALQKSLADARLRLMEILSSYTSFKGWTLVVVFDAHKVKDGRGSFERYDRHTHMVFTGKNETADSLIEKMVYDMKNEYKIKVATSDKDQQYYVLTQGAIRVSARELWQDINNVKRQMQLNNYTHLQTGENHFLKHRVGSDIRDRMEKLRRGYVKD